MKFKVGDKVRIHDPKSDFYKVESVVIGAFRACEENYYELDNELGEWLEEDLELVKPTFKVGDTVRIVNPPGGDNAGKISTIVSTYRDSLGEPIYTLDNQDVKLSCVNWGSKYLELVPFGVGDCVKYKTGNTAYEVTAINCDRIALKHLGNKKTYPEYNPDKLMKLQFKIGDIVEVCNPVKYKGIIRTIEEIDCRKEAVFYKISNLNEKIAEQNLKLATQDSKKEPKPTYYKGDIVYIDPDKVEDQTYCYQLFEVVKDSTDISVICTNSKFNEVGLIKEYLKKPAFKVGEYFTIKHRNYEIKDVHFDNKRLCYKLQDLYIVAFYTERELLQIVERENDKLIKALDDSIINFNLNENDKDQLQREGTPEQSGCNEGGSRVYGRKPKSAIKVGHLGYKKVIGGGKSRIGRA